MPTPFENELLPTSNITFMYLLNDLEQNGINNEGVNHLSKTNWKSMQLFLFRKYLLI